MWPSCKFFGNVSTSCANVDRFVYRPTVILLEEDVDMCKCMWVSCNVVQPTAVHEIDCVSVNRKVNIYMHITWISCYGIEEGNLNSFVQYQ
jgi:hypothetical protein